MSDLLDLLCEALHRGFTFASFLLERCLSQLYSSLRTTVISLTLTDSKATVSDRAWWDTSKGSAVVIWAPGDQTISQALSLSLACIRARPGSKRAGRPPYTIIVVLPSAKKGLETIITSWATRKARVEGGKDPHRGREPIASWSFLGLGRFSFRLSSPESQGGESASPDEFVESEVGRSAYPERRSPDSRPITPTHGKRRRLSFGGWHAPDVVGMGMDMLKGLQIGQTQSQGIGAIIPVVADTSTPDGVNYAHTTIRAYCTSHDLLLRALIVVPSILSDPLGSPSSSPPVDLPPHFNAASTGGSSRSRQVSSAIEKDELHYQFLSSGHSTLSNRSLNRTHLALTTDISETMNVIASLLPALKTDGGRIIGLVPCAFRSPNSRKGLSFSSDKSRFFYGDDKLEFNVTRKGVLEMWSNLRKRLITDGVHVSQVHMAIPYRPKETIKARTLRVKSTISQTRLRKVAHHLLAKLHYIFYPVPRAQEAFRGHSNRQVDDENDDLEACPSLMLDAVRSILVRTWPRDHYSVGLGPRLESMLEHVPGRQYLYDWVESQL